MIPRPIDSKQRASELLAHFNNYNQAAIKLGARKYTATLWRFLNEDDFKPSKHFLKALWGWADVEPVIIEAAAGSTIFGEVGLLKLGKVANILILSPPEIDESLIIKCQVCGRKPSSGPGTRNFVSSTVTLLQRAGVGTGSKRRSSGSEL